ncbi:MAG: DUF58 domain-containing protein [Treponema sp.]|jgi:uncharacterized protein (DUF58 family)|nr:DUF58 domain-containing protein [Treponema sp.]
MDRRELLGRIVTFPIIAAGLAEDLLAGNYRSIFRGQGIEFDGVRRYERGDDIRTIDWNASARFGRPYVKTYREERELSVFIVLDCSASMFTGSGLTRFEQGLMAAALIAFSAERAGQQTGALFYDREITRIFPPGKGRRHIMTILQSALDYSPAGRGSGLGAAILGAGRLLRRRSLAVIVSDFLAVNWERELEELARRHDVIALRLCDPMDAELPAAGLIPLEDPETAARIHAPSLSESFRSAWAQWHGDRADLWEALCRKSGAASLELSTAADAAESLFRFFGGRRGAAFHPVSRRAGSGA